LIGVNILKEWSLPRKVRNLHTMFFLNQPKFGRMRSEPSKRMDDLQAGYLVNWLLAHVAKNHGQGNDWEWELPHYGHPPNRLNQVRILGSERNLVGGF
jgi:hypothetical protein